MTIGSTDTNAAGVVVSMINNNLGTLNLTGTGKVAIYLVDTNSGALTVNNSGTGSDSIKASSLSYNTINLVGKVGLTAVDNSLRSLTLGSSAVTISDSYDNTNNMTISGAANNGNNTFNLSGTGTAAKTQTITLGNGYNQIVDMSATATNTVNLTVGTGANFIALGGATGGSTYNVTSAAHATSTPSLYEVGAAGAGYATTANYTITGAQSGDIISFSNDTASTSTTPTITDLTLATSSVGAISLLETAAAAANSLAYGYYGGSTYIVENATGTHGTTASTVVNLAGINTPITASTGYVTLGSSAATSPTVVTSVPAGSTYTLVDTIGHTISVTGNSSTATTIDMSKTTGALTITGGGTVDTIKTGTGTATVTGGAGTDTITLGASGQTIVYAKTTGETLGGAAIVSGTTNVSTADQIKGATSVFATGHTLKIDLSGDGVTYTAGTPTVGTSVLDGLTASGIYITTATEVAGVFTATNASPTHSLVQFDTNGATADGVQVIDITGVVVSAAISAAGILTLTF